MNGPYHRELTTHALGQHFAPEALETIIQANLHQDDLKYLLGAYPHYHFDDNEFARAYAYLDEQRQLILETLTQRRPISLAWEALGKIAHTLQDFYAHTNYVQLWRDQFPPSSWPNPETIEPLIPELIAHPRLISGRVFLLLEVLGTLPLVGPWLHPLFPADTHIRMNLDQPKTGPLFPYAMVAARKRTEIEFQTLSQHITSQLGPPALKVFQGHP
ncbi:MAG TPA: hypothetical protein PK530_10815 [Anaerolineales bacterium]|nr:hypothetical protein [Anaerolineales bacterium]